MSETNLSKTELDKVRRSFIHVSGSHVWNSRDEKSKNIQDKLDEARVKELNLKHWSRILISIFSAILLVWQNWQVFDVVNKAFQNGQLKDLQVIFAALVAATLTETYFIMKIIVNFVFSSNDYTYDKTKSD